TLVYDIAAGAAFSFPEFFQLLSGQLLFAANDAIHGTELWSTPIEDFGDAPESYGTSRASDGARHLSVGPQLGPLRSEETDATVAITGQATDDDGLVAASPIAGGQSSVTV